MKIEITGYWTFFCSPAKWEIDKFLSSNIEYDTYQVTKWQKDYFQVGQLGVIRVGIDKRTKTQLDGSFRLQPGIYGIVEILSKAHPRAEKSGKFWLKWSDKELKNPVGDIRYLKNLLNRPLLLKDIENDDAIKLDKYLISGFQASSMPLQERTFKRILELVGDEKQIFEAIEPEVVSNLNDIQKLEEKYKYAIPQVKEIISRRIERGKISQEIKKITGYKCLICDALGQNPYVFKKSNGELFIEAHHVIPVAKEKEGSLSVTQIITICPNHHRQLHFGQVTLISNTETEFVYLIDNQKIVIKKIKIS